MFRSFCAGAVAGFLFGSTKKGQDVRQGIDGFLTELTSSDAMKTLDEKKNDLSEMASNTFSKFTGKFSEEDEAKSDSRDGKKNGSSIGKKNGKSEEKKSAEQNFEPEAESQDEASDDPLQFSGTAKALDADKAQELADKLGAKPSTPEDENLAAFQHHDDDLKSA